MSARVLDDWAASRSLYLPLNTLKGWSVGIDASYYLHQHLHHPTTREPLLIALGGFPFALRANIERELETLKSLGIECVFVFDGLDFGYKDSPRQARAESSRAFEQAWELYDQQQAEQVVDSFSNAGSPKPTELYRFLQKILLDNQVQFLVAPYSAAAQLWYMSTAPTPLIDTIYGSAETLFFDVEKVITRIDLEASNFYWVSKQALIDEHPALSNGSFLHFALLLGSRYLPTFPPFEHLAFPGRPMNIREAIHLFNNAGRNALTLCAQFEEDRRVQELNYADLFKRAYMTIKHHIITDVEGKVAPLDPGHAPSDLHQLLGLRLPEELYYYLARAVLGSNIPNYLTGEEVVIPLPLGVEDSDIYRQLMGDILMPIRTQAVALLSNSLHRFYQTKTIKVRLWYEDTTDRSITLKDIVSVKDTIQSWHVTGPQFPADIQSSDAVSLKRAVEALTDSSFVSKTFGAKDAPVLSTPAEIIFNVYWRFLQLRGYVDSKHDLTAWGKCLLQALSVVDTGSPLEENVLLAIELLRLGILGPNNWFSRLSGGPIRGSDDEKTFNRLVSRVACIGKLRHKPIGYSGPLSRQLLSFRSLVSAVRSSLRDLIEIVFTSMLLSGNVDRSLKSLTAISLQLPFINDNDCGLGIAVRTYLDDLMNQQNPTSPETRNEIKTRGKDWFQHSEDFNENLNSAFTLWDAVYKATQNADEEFKDAALWDRANSWLADRR